MSPGIHAVACLACAAGAVLAIYRVYDRSVSAAIAYMLGREAGPALRAAHDGVGMKAYAGAWGYMVLALLLAGLTGFLMAGGFGA